MCYHNKVTSFQFLCVYTKTVTYLHTKPTMTQVVSYHCALLIDWQGTMNGAWNKLRQQGLDLPYMDEIWGGGGGGGYVKYF